MRTRHARPVWSASVLMISASGCGILGPEGCPADLRGEVEPRQATLKVGGTFDAEARAFGCGGSEELSVDMRWVTSDGDVLAVGRESGRVVGLAVGAALVVGTDLGSVGIGPVEIPVQVVE